MGFLSLPSLRIYILYAEPAKIEDMYVRPSSLTGPAAREGDPPPPPPSQIQSEMFILSGILNSTCHQGRSQDFLTGGGGQI